MTHDITAYSHPRFSQETEARIKSHSLDRRDERLLKMVGDELDRRGADWFQLIGEELSGIRKTLGALQQRKVDESATTECITKGLSEAQEQSSNRYASLAAIISAMESQIAKLTDMLAAHEKQDQERDKETDRLVKAVEALTKSALNRTIHVDVAAPQVTVTNDVKPTPIAVTNQVQPTPIEVNNNITTPEPLVEVVNNVSLPPAVPHRRTIIENPDGTMTLEVD